MPESGSSRKLGPCNRLLQCFQMVITNQSLIWRGIFYSSSWKTQNQIKRKGRFPKQTWKAFNQRKDEVQKQNCLRQITTDICLVLCRSEPTVSPNDGSTSRHDLGTRNGSRVSSRVSRGFSRRDRQTRQRESWRRRQWVCKQWWRQETGTGFTQKTGQRSGEIPRASGEVGLIRESFHRIFVDF